MPEKPRKLLSFREACYWGGACIGFRELFPAARWSLSRYTCIAPPPSFCIRRRNTTNPATSPQSRHKAKWQFCCLHSARINSRHAPKRQQADAYFSSAEFFSFFLSVQKNDQSRWSSGKASETKMRFLSFFVQSKFSPYYQLWCAHISRQLSSYRTHAHSVESTYLQRLII